MGLELVDRGDVSGLEAGSIHEKLCILQVSVDLIRLVHLFRNLSISNQGPKQVLEFCEWMETVAVLHADLDVC